MIDEFIEFLLIYIVKCPYYCTYHSERDPKRFISTFQQNQMNSGDGNYVHYAKMDGSRMGEREKQVRTDRRGLQYAQSESRHASRRMDAGTGHLQRAYSGNEQDLPRFNRKSPINEYHAAALFLDRF